MNEVDLILSKIPESRKCKRGIFSTIISDFAGLAFEGISSIQCQPKQTYKETNVCI